MKMSKTAGVFLAAMLSVAFHLSLLIYFPDRAPPVLIKGGSPQIAIDLNSTSSTAMAAGAQEQEQEKEVDDQKTKPDTQEPAPRPIPTPVSQPETMTQAEPSPAIAKSKPEPEPKPKSKPPTADQDQPEGGAPSPPSVGSSSKDGGVDQPANKAGNSQSENYAGNVMEHLSRIRRPRASTPGSALVAFTIASSGELENASIVRSSGSSQFDRDALKMVRRAAPFPKPPPDVNREFVVEIEGA